MINDFGDQKLTQQINTALDLSNNRHCFDPYMTPVHTHETHIHVRFNQL